jgi:uncharacterized phage-like protein YoqJ
MIVMVTGHRPPRIGGYHVPNPTEMWVRDTLHRVLESLRGRFPDGLEAISGMALGTDQIFAKVCLHLDIPFTAAIPFRGQERAWPEDSQDSYRRLVRRASRVVVVDETPGYSVDNPKAKFLVRNKWMLDQAGLVIAVWDGSGGGTNHAVLEAQRRGMRMMVLDPMRRTIRNVGIGDPLT